MLFFDSCVSETVVFLRHEALDRGVRSTDQHWDLFGQVVKGLCTVSANSTRNNSISNVRLSTVLRKIAQCKYICL